jgi:RNA polymerase sigma-70 factor (ECF subfamily)
MLTCASPFNAAVAGNTGTGVLWERWDLHTGPLQRMKETVPGRSNLSARFVREAPASAPLSTPLSPTEGVTFDRVYVEHFQHVSRWARALGGMEADLDDITQEVFLVVRRKLSSYVGPSMQAWLYGITRRTVSDYRRRAFFRRLFTGVNRSLESSPQVERTSGVDPFARLEAQQAIGAILKKMSTVRRSAFILFEIEGYSGEEIAELEQIPVATVYTRLHHARRDFLRLTAELTGLPREEPSE